MYDLVDIGRQVMANLFTDLHAMYEPTYQVWTALQPFE